MGFQSAFNQMVGSIGIATAMSPALKEFGEEQWREAGLKQQYARSEKRMAATEGATSSAEAEIYEQNRVKALELSQKLAATNPSAENLARYKKEADLAEEVSGGMEFADTALESLQKQTAARLEQKRKLKELGEILLSNSPEAWRKK